MNNRLYRQKLRRIRSFKDNVENNIKLSAELSKFLNKVLSKLDMDGLSQFDINFHFNIIQNNIDAIGNFGSPKGRRFVIPIDSPMDGVKGIVSKLTDIRSNVLTSKENVAVIKSAESKVKSLGSKYT